MPDRDSLSSLNKQNELDSSVMRVSQDCLKSIAQNFGVVLLYHGTFSESPSILGSDFHNTTAEQLFKQLESLSRYFRFVSIDEFSAASDRSGLASVTIDDGYRSVLEETVRVFEALEIPAALFLNRAFMQGKSFWRDKVRLLASNNWVGEFEQRFAGRFTVRPGQSFYRYTKNPANNSIDVENALDEFLEDRGTLASFSELYLQGEAMLKPHPLIAYGSHSVNHYVMSSLSEQEQWREIEENRRFLNSFENVQTTDVFSVPFGGERDYNDATMQLAVEAGHSALLLSRGMIQKGEHVDRGVLPEIDRLMPRTSSAEGLHSFLFEKAAV